MRSLYHDGMVRIVVTPTWANLIDFETTAGLGRDVVPHDLRHWYASQLLNAGESVVTVADRLGHSNATTVLKTYSHLIDGQEDRTRRAIDEAFGSHSARAAKPAPATRPHEA